MRIPLVAGNWKMNTTIEEAVALARSTRERIDGIPGVRKAVCPPFVSLGAVRDVLAGSEVLLGAQNVHPGPNGAFTGEVSVEMLRGVVDHVIVGHSERRAMFGETDAHVASRAVAAAEAGLRPIVCVGEPLDVRERGEALETVSAQLASSLEGYEGWDLLTVAYEPVWAIGTGRAASPEIAQEMMSHLRTALAKLGGCPAFQAAILYGGSVDADNAAQFLQLPDVDGALVGGASLKPEGFADIVKQAAKVAAQ